MASSHHHITALSLVLFLSMLACKGDETQASREEARGKDTSASSASSKEPGASGEDFVSENPRGRWGWMENGQIPGYRACIEDLRDNCPTCPIKQCCVGGVYTSAALPTCKMNISRDSYYRKNFRKECASNDVYGCYFLGKALREEGNHKDANQEFERACSFNVKDSCFLLGSNFIEGHGAAKDIPRANELFERGCKGGDEGSCVELGLSYAIARGVNKDSARAAALYADACEADAFRGCTLLGMMHSEGEGVKEDKARANQLFQQACDLDDARACVLLGSNRFFGRGIARDSDAARALHEKACELSHEPGCFQYVTMTERPREVVEHRMTRPCDENREGSACTTLGIYYSKTSQLGRAKKLLERTCEAGHASGCHYLGLLYARKKETARAHELHKKACAGGEPKGCTRVGMNLTLSGSDVVEANRYLEKACDGMDILGCVVLAINLQRGDGGGEDFERANKLLEEGCEHELGVACFHAGVSHEHGLGTKRDYSKSSAFFTSACALGFWRGCLELGLHHRYGHGVKKSYREATTYLTLACGKTGEVRSPEGCIELGMSHYAQKNNYESALLVLNDLCKAGNMEGCFYRGYVQFMGKPGYKRTPSGLDRDHEWANRYYKKACDGGFAMACFELGVNHQAGKLGAKRRADPELAREYFGKACRAGFQPACKSGAKTSIVVTLKRDEHAIPNPNTTQKDAPSPSTTTEKPASQPPRMKLERTPPGLKLMKGRQRLR